MKPETCSAVSLARDESLAGTASQVRRWLLVEDPGPWGYDAVTQNGLPPGLFSEVRVWARSVGARIVLIRRGPKRTPGARKVFLASSYPGGEWIAAVPWEELGSLITLGRAALDRGEGVVWDRVPSLYLVCTHGRHDLCCSVQGNPVSRVVCAEYGNEAWECSHIGGDRFAANLICLPHGVYFGRLLGTSVVEVIEDYKKGSLNLEYLRGTSAWPFAVQAAEIEIRKARGWTGTGDIVPVSWARVSDDELEVSFSTTTGPLDVTVRVTKSAREQYLTCRSTEPGHPPTYEIV